MLKTSLSSSILSTHSEVKFLIDSLEKKDSITPEMRVTLNQINTLEHSGLISSEESLLIKNNLTSAQDLLFAEGVLSDLILKLVKQEKLAPEMKNAVEKYGLQKTILLLYTCHLEQTYSTLEPYIIQQQIWKYAEYRPKELFIRMQEAEEMESKKYVKEWLSSLKPSNSECKTALEPLLKPLTGSEFKEQFLKFLNALYESEDNLISQFCLEEMIDLLNKQPETHFHLAIAQIIKASNFYQKHIEKIGSKTPKEHQFSLCLAADAIKNAPYAKELSLYYHLIYGQIKKKWEDSQRPLTIKSAVLIEGSSSDEQSISRTIERVFEKIKQPFYKIAPSSFKENLKLLIQSLIKKAPGSIITAASSQYQEILLKASKALQIPITYLSSHTNTTEWEDLSSDAHPYFRIAFPIPLNQNDLPNEINREKTRISGIPGLFQNTKNQDELKQKWGFDPSTKVVLIHTPEGNSPWPSFLAKEYSSAKDLAVIILTDEKNRSFIHTLKTKIAPKTNLPLTIYTAPTSLEKEELLTLADLVIGKEKKEDSSLLFQTWQAKTPLLLDNSTPSLFSGGILNFLSKLHSFFLSKKESPETELHENLLNDQNLGIMIRSKENFKLAFEELLDQETEISAPLLLADQIPSLLEEMNQESKNLKTRLTLHLKGLASS